MKNNLIYKVFAITLFTILIILSIILNARAVKVSTVDNFFNTKDEKNKNQLIVKFLKNLDSKTIETIGIAKSDILDENLSQINIDIVSKSNDNYYIILYNTNPYNDKDYINIFKRGTFFYKHIGNPIKLNNIMDIFILKAKESKDYILFTRDLIGFETAPLDLTVNLNAFVYDKTKRNFIKALEIVENTEEYQITSDGEKNMYKKFRSKSDIMLTNSSIPSIEILTQHYEALSEPFKNELSKDTPYNLNFDVIKTSSNYNKYFYDENFKHFVLGYLEIEETKEIAGILKADTKIINDNFKDTYTIIKKDGEIFEIFDGFRLLKLN